jgi:hypothetical protein
MGMTEPRAPLDHDDAVEDDWQCACGRPYRADIYFIQDGVAHRDISCRAFGWLQAPVGTPARWEPACRSCVDAQAVPHCDHRDCDYGEWE